MKSITKAQDGWRVVARVRVNRKIIQKRQTIQGTKEEAKALLERLKVQIRTGKIVTPNSLTITPKFFKNILGVYRIKSKNAPFSQGHERRVSLLEKLLGDSDAIQFPERFERLIAEYRVKGKNHQANRFVEIATAAFEVCVKLKHFDANPITEERFPCFKETARDVYLSAERVTQIILIAAKNRRTCHLARALQYYFSVPCRKTEVVRMRIADVDLFRQRVRVYNGTTKNEVGVWKPIPPAMLKWFKRRVRDSQSIEEHVFGRRIDASGKFVHLGDFKRSWDTVRREAGHPKLRIHDSRHISATDMVNNGTPRTVVNAVAGWKTDMLRTYFHLDSDAALTHIRWPEKPKCEASVKPLATKIV
jgi:integrase